MGKVIAVLGLVLALALLGVGVFAWWQGRGATHRLAAAEQASGSATVAAGQAQAGTQALRITVAGEARDRQADELAQENRNAILKAPGADQVLEPGFVRRLDLGLCEHAAYRDDPGRAEVCGPDPGLAPPAGEGDRAP